MWLFVFSAFDCDLLDFWQGDNDQDVFVIDHSIIRIFDANDFY